MKILAILSQHAVRFTFSCAVIFLLLLHSTGILNLDAISRFEYFTYDIRLNMLMPGKVDERIVIIDIDEKSLQEQGRRPWSRNKLADLVNQLFDVYQSNVLIDT
ncbi:MAG: CHASE2 domain-containing protein [Methylotenera sp.]|nr:CHASE2 domain-containing protein [Methylotenera sp.]MSP99484.1 CHASE2 domain-containing protein [Methylotenera sp.]